MSKNKTMLLFYFHGLAKNLMPALDAELRKETIFNALHIGDCLENPQLYLDWLEIIKAIRNEQKDK